MVFVDNSNEIEASAELSSLVVASDSPAGKVESERIVAGTGVLVLSSIVSFSVVISARYGEVIAVVVAG